MCPTVLYNLGRKHSSTLISYVHRRIGIAVDMSVARRASPFPYGKVFRSFVLITALMTKLAGREELVYLNKFLSLLFQFILQERGKYSPTVISNGLSKVQ